jgi:voltage-gated potassium channel
VVLILILITLVSVCVFIHAAGMWLGLRTLLFLWKRSAENPSLVHGIGILTGAVGGLLLMHLLQILVWGIFYHQFELLPDLETAIYFSATSYSTLGYGDVLLSTHWRILGAAEAVTGVLMFGWSTGALFMLANRLHGLYLDPQNRLK